MAFSVLRLSIRSRRGGMNLRVAKISRKKKHVRTSWEGEKEAEARPPSTLKVAIPNTSSITAAFRMVAPTWNVAHQDREGPHPHACRHQHSSGEGCLDLRPPKQGSNAEA